MLQSQNVDSLTSLSTYVTEGRLRSRGSWCALSYDAYSHSQPNYSLHLAAVLPSDEALEKTFFGVKVYKIDSFFYVYACVQSNQCFNFR